MSPRAYLAYALPALPLALFALPLYVHVPKLYAERGGLSLAAIGAVLLSARLCDAIVDPWLGRWSDHHARPRMLLLALPFLLGGSGLLFNPPPEAGAGWLLGALLLAYFGYSLATINHQAWGAEFPADEQGRLAASAWREGASLCGVLLAAALPALLAEDAGSALQRLLWGFAPVMAATLLLAILLVPSPAPLRATAATGPLLRDDAAFVRLLAVNALNGIAAAIPATLVLFYVQDVLVAPAWSGVFLCLYFLAGALAMPLWVRLAERQGRIHAWLLSMLLAMLSFCITPWLGAGDVLWFALVCLMSGLALGADLALPSALLAEQVAVHGGPAARYGWWAAIGKLNLALAAGLALPLVSAFGYSPGQAGSGTQALALAYGGLPLLLKFAALLLLLHVRPLLLRFDRGVLS